MNLEFAGCSSRNYRACTILMHARGLHQHGTVPPAQPGRLTNNDETLWMIDLGSKVKQSRKEKEAELAEVIAELSLQVEIKGSCRKPTWRDQPVVLLAMLPVHSAM